jgi:hypothetical protein
LKLRRLATWAIVFGFSLPVWAGERPGAISGYVRNSAGTPQMGAIVEILGAADRSLIVFTNASGFYTATDLLPGLYTLKVSAPSFLPTLREKVGLQPGANLNVNITLSTLLGVMQLSPARNIGSDDDDWKWTLRSVANRPILRFDDPQRRVAQNQGSQNRDPQDYDRQNNDPQNDDLESPESAANHEFRGSLAFVAGSAAGGYGTGSNMSASFNVERSVFSEGEVSFSGNFAYGDTLPAGVFRAAYANHLDNGSDPSVAVTVRRFAPADPSLHGAALQSLALSAGDDFTLGDIVELKFGSELQTIQFLGHLTAFRPYGSADAHLSPNTVLEYSYDTSRPDLRTEKGFDSAPDDMSETNPRVSLLGFAPKIEDAHHQEISVSQRIGDNNIQVAAYSDRIADPALTGVGDVTSAGGYLLPDVTSGTFSYTGRDLDTAGVRVVLQHKFSSDLSATLDYAYGGVLTLSQPDAPLQTAQQWISAQHRHAVTAKLSGTLPHAHTRWIASYRWVNGSALTPVDLFNTSAGQSEAYLNFFIRQPFPCLGGRIEAIIDLRNLLAQGYIPVVGQDGQTIYLVDSARSIRGGLAFNF